VHYWAIGARVSPLLQHTCIFAYTLQMHIGPNAKCQRVPVLDLFGCFFSVIVVLTNLLIISF